MQGVVAVWGQVLVVAQAGGSSGSHEAPERHGNDARVVPHRIRLALDRTGPATWQLTDTLSRERVALRGVWELLFDDDGRGGPLRELPRVARCSPSLSVMS